MNSLIGKIRRALKIEKPIVDESNLHLIEAFPAQVREDVITVLSGLPFDPHSYQRNCYSVKVSGEQLIIPYRVYHEIPKIRSAQLTASQNELLQCILTRHSDGLVRQQSLERIIRSKRPWVPAYVVQLAGEYVVEILSVIEQNLNSLDDKIYSEFLTENREFFSATAQRIDSYWDCYYREMQREGYPGFRVLRYFRDVADKDK